MPAKTYRLVFLFATALAPSIASIFVHLFVWEILVFEEHGKSVSLLTAFAQSEVMT